MRFSSRRTPGARSTLVSYSFLDSLGPLVLNARTRSMSGTFGGRLQLSTIPGKSRPPAPTAARRCTTGADNQPNAAALRAALADKNPADSLQSLWRRDESGDASTAIRESRDVYSKSGDHDGKPDAAAARCSSCRPVRVKMALGSEWRKERLVRQMSSGRSGNLRSRSGIRLRRARHVRSSGSRASRTRRRAWSCRWPAVTSATATSAARRIRRSACAGRSTDAVKLRTSWGTSFKAPKLVNVYDLANNRMALALDA